MGNDWILALEQQTDLSVTRGSTIEVASAGRRGSDLRLYMDDRNLRGDAVFSTDLCRRGR